MLCAVALATVLGVVWGNTLLTVPLQRSLSASPTIITKNLLVSLGENTTNLPVDGNVLPYGIFWTQLNLGTPGHPYNVAIDTGSDSTIVSQKGCVGCNISDITKEYDPSSSSSATKVTCGHLYCTGCVDGQCRFSNSYQTCDLNHPTAVCTIKGPIWSDAWALGGIAGSAPVRFGGIVSQTENFQQFSHIHGVMGVASTENSNWGMGNPVQLLARESQIPSAEFALCLSDKGGKMTIGGTDPSLHTGDFQYTPAMDLGLYSLHLNQMSIKSTVVPISHYPNVIVDSGTNILLLPASVFEAVEKAFRVLCSTTPLPHMCDANDNFFQGKCYPLTSTQLAEFPPLELHMKGADLAIAGRNYILETPGTPGTYCLGIKNTGSSFFIVGDTLMTDYYTVFDRKNSRIGWAPVNAANCW